MEKQKLLDIDVESLQLICVNPYEVNPVNHQNILSQQISTTDVTLQDAPSTSQQTSLATNGGEFYEPQQKKIKLEMEEFSNLSQYLHRKPKSRNSVDELNIPIFDENLPGYDFNFNYSQSDQQQQKRSIKLESDSYYGNNLLIDNILKNSTIDVKKINNNEYNTISEIDNIQLQNSVVSVLSPPESDSGSVYDHPKTKSFNVSGISYHNNIDHHSALGINSKNETIYSNVSSPSTDMRHRMSGVTSPDNSVCSSNCPTPNKLALNVNVTPVDNFDLATPSIIEDVVQLENHNFNILEYMQNETIAYETINLEDLLGDSSQAKPLYSGKVKDFNKSPLDSYVAKKRPRKKRLPEDDDEDYVPPSERSAHKRPVFEDISDSDSDIEIERKARTKPRGRPPKRTGSVSSDCSKDSDASKYRELRDKNNEASRRSRMKRKLKEQELENEADELYSKNIKLKAQVEELEKLVTKFREDLFKMIRK